MVTQIERIAVVETKVNSIDSKVDGLHIKLDTFIECADSKYASKKRVNVIEEKVNKHDIKLAYYAGGVGVFIIIIQVLIKTFLG